MSKLKVDEIRSADRSVSDSANIILADDGNVKIPSFVGMIAPFAMTTPPTGWLACDGTAVSRTTYVDLFTAIGTTWGVGDGSSTFALPDLEGAFLRGVGTSTINTRNKVGPTNVGDFQEDQFQGHYFGDVSSSYASSSTNAPLKISDSRRNQAPSAYADNNHGIVDTQAGSYGNSLVPISNQSNGDPRIGNDTRPFNAGVKFCIKY